MTPTPSEVLFYVSVAHRCTVLALRDGTAPDAAVDDACYRLRGSCAMNAEQIAGELGVAVMRVVVGCYRRAGVLRGGLCGRAVA